MRFKFRKNSGITLIALVITVIVLLILVGVTLNLVGEDGIIAKARWSAYITEYEAVDEQKEMYAAYHMYDKYGKTVIGQTQTAALSTVTKTVEEKIKMYPVSDQLEIDSMYNSMKETIKSLEGVEDLTDENLVNLYKVDFSKIEADAKKSYAINIVSGMLYSIEYEEYQGKLYHTPQYGIANSGEVDNEKVDTKITETGTYEMIIDAGQIVSWDSIVIQYSKYVENSLSMKVYSSDDEINWTEETVEELAVNEKQEATYNISSANRTQYLKMEITIDEVNGENSELDYILVNFYKFRKTDVEPEINATGAVENNGIYTVPTSSNGQVEATGTATVTQTITVPEDANEYMINIEEVFGNPSTTVTIDGTEYTVSDVEELKKIAIKPGSTIEITTTLNAGDGIGKVELLAKEINLSSSEKNTTASEKEEVVQEWRTVEQKRYMYNNGGTGFWEACYVEEKLVDETGIIIESEDAVKRIVVRYQVSSDGSSWSGYFTNIEEAANTQYLRVVVDYQVLGDVEYGDTSNNKIKVILNDGSWVATFVDEDGKELFTKRVYFENSDKQGTLTLPSANLAKDEKVFVGWKNNSKGYDAGTTYTLTEDIEFTAIYAKLNIYKVEDLVEFRDIANIGITFNGLTVNLMNDLDLSSVCNAEEGKSWTPIITFKGTFEGNEKTISNLYINSSSGNQALFRANEGIIENLEVTGNVVGALCSGGVVARNYGSIINCINKVNVTAYGTAHVIAGIASNNRGIIENCINKGNINGCDSVGGISSINAGVIKKCYNYGKILTSKTTAGGIASQNGNGEWGGNGYIYNCYNNAIVSGTSTGIGGIVGLTGWANAKGYIYNSYTIVNTTINGLTNSGGTAVIKNCYTTDANSKITELNAGIDDINLNLDVEQPWKADTNNINNGYPILSWQE